jgi:hypothetical protein
MFRLIEDRVSRDAPLLVRSAVLAACLRLMVNVCYTVDYFDFGN